MLPPRTSCPGRTLTDTATYARSGRGGPLGYEQSAGLSDADISSSIAMVVFATAIASCHCYNFAESQLAIYISETICEPNVSAHQETLDPVIRDRVWRIIQHYSSSTLCCRACHYRACYALRVEESSTYLWEHYAEQFIRQLVTTPRGRRDVLICKKLPTKLPG